MPVRRRGEQKESFVNRCMSDSEMKERFPNLNQRLSVCNVYANAGLSKIDLILDKFNSKKKD